MLTRGKMPLLFCFGKHSIWWAMWTSEADQRWSDQCLVPTHSSGSFIWLAHTIRHQNIKIENIFPKSSPQFYFDHVLNCYLVEHAMSWIWPKVDLLQPCFLAKIFHIKIFQVVKNISKLLCCHDIECFPGWLRVTVSGVRWSTVTLKLRLLRADHRSSPPTHWVSPHHLQPPVQHQSSDPHTPQLLSTNTNQQN